MNVSTLKDLLKKNNLKPNYTYGQNFLIDESVLDNMTEASKISAEDAVLEIGPGIGNLTRKLCEQAGFVLSVEKDPKFLPILKSLKKDFKNFRYEIADILEFDFQTIFRSKSTSENPNLQIPTNKDNQQLSVDPDDIRKSGSGYKVVANIPYFITGKILQMLMTAKNKPSSVTLLTQKEVAENIIAKAGHLSLLAISVQIYGNPKIISIVPKESFYPKPKVDSAILHVDLPRKAKYKIEDEKKLFKVLRACFSGKRKQIHNTLVNNLRLDKNKVQEILSTAKISPTARPQELTIEQWIKLTNQIFI